MQEVASRSGFVKGKQISLAKIPVKTRTSELRSFFWRKVSKEFATNCEGGEGPPDREVGGCRQRPQPPTNQFFVGRSALAFRTVLQAQVGTSSLAAAQVSLSEQGQVLLDGITRA
jgi:hypothetical protein